MALMAILTGQYIMGFFKNYFRATKKSNDRMIFKKLCELASKF
jgi:hypothetical protein